MQVEKLLPGNELVPNLLCPTSTQIDVKGQMILEVAMSFVSLRFSDRVLRQTGGDGQRLISRPAKDGKKYYTRIFHVSTEKIWCHFTQCP